MEQETITDLLMSIRHIEGQLEFSEVMAVIRME